MTEETLDEKRSRFCREKCGGKCCHMHLSDEPAPIRCPKLSADNTCSIYAQRYGGTQASEPLVLVGQFRSKRYRTTAGKPVYRPFWCGHIEQIIAAGKLPKHIEDGCCYKHEHLLEELPPHD